MEKEKGIVEQLFVLMSDSFFPASSYLSVEMFHCQKTWEGLERKEKEKVFTVFACKFWSCQKVECLAVQSHQFLHLCHCCWNWYHEW